MKLLAPRARRRRRAPHRNCRDRPVRDRRAVHHRQQCLRQPVEGRQPAEGGRGGGLFLPGRVDGVTTPQLKALFDQAAKPLSDATIGQKMNDCMKNIQGKVELLQSLAPKQAAQPATTTPRPAQPQQKQQQPKAAKAVSRVKHFLLFYTKALGLSGAPPAISRRSPCSTPGRPANAAASSSRSPGRSRRRRRADVRRGGSASRRRLRPRRPVRRQRPRRAGTSATGPPSSGRWRRHRCPE